MSPRPSLSQDTVQQPESEVRLGSEAAASADEVVCDPRIFQAAYHRNAPVTPDEVAIASALHEVMHLVSTNLDESRAPRRLADRGEIAPDAKVDLLTALERNARTSRVAEVFSLEDARQEAQVLLPILGPDRSWLISICRR